MSVLGFEPKGTPSYFQRIHIIILTTHHRVTPKNTNTPITMLHIGQIILVYYTTNHLISQSKNATLTGAFLLYSNATPL